MCTVYLVQVNAVSITDEFGPAAVEYMQTAEEGNSFIILF